MLKKKKKKKKNVDQYKYGTVSRCVPALGPGKISVFENLTFVERNMFL